MNWYAKTSVSLCLLAFFLNTAAQELPFKPFSARYDVLHNGDHVAVTTLSLVRQNEDTWLYASMSEAVGWIARMFGGKVTEQSLFSWNGDIRIISYRYDRNSSKKHVKLKFDWQNMEVTNDINGDPWQMTLSPGTLDKLSANLALVVRLSSGETSARLPVADGGKLKIYDFNIVGEELIDTPLGRVKTVKVSRNKHGRADRQAWLWLAPELNYMIIKVEKDGSNENRFTMIIQSLKQQ